MNRHWRSPVLNALASFQPPGPDSSDEATPGRSAPSAATSIVLTWASARGRYRPGLCKFLALLDRARIWAHRGQVRDTLATVQAALQLLESPSPVLRARADELRAELGLSLGDLRAPAELARGLPAVRRSFLTAKIALAGGDGHTAREQLQTLRGAAAPRHELVRQLLIAAAAIECGDPAAAGIMGGALNAARHAGFLNTVVTTARQVTSYLIEHAPQMLEGQFTDLLIAAECDRLTAGAGKRLTVVVGSAGSGKSVLLSSWASARPPGTTCWLSCDKADAHPPRFWRGFIESLSQIEPGFGGDAAGLLAVETAMADAISAIANNAANLPSGSAIVVDDFRANPSCHRSPLLALPHALALGRARVR